MEVVAAVVVLGVGVVLPMAAGGRWRWWLVSAAAAAAALAAPVGTAAVIGSMPWLLTSSCRAWLEGRELCRARSFEAATRTVAAGYAVVAAGAFVASRSGWTVLGIEEPFVELTAVHFVYAGAGAVALAASFGRSPQPQHVRRLSRWAAGLTAGAPPLVAVGFILGSAAGQVGGAVMLTAGVFLTAALALRTAASPGAPRVAQMLLALSGLSVWITMPLAVAWAAGQHWDVPALSVPAMARTHGLGNALAFIVAGLAAQRLVAQRFVARPAPPQPSTDPPARYERTLVQ